MPRAATPWPPGRLRSPARPAPHAPVQVSLRAPGRPPGPGSRLAGRWKVPGGPLRDSPRVVQVALSQCGRCRPSWGREAAPSRGPRPAERGRGETPAPLIGAHRRGCTRGGATARLALRRVPQRGPRGHMAPPLLPRGLSEVWQNPAHLTVCEREPCQLILFFKKQYLNLFFRFFFFFLTAFVFCGLLFLCPLARTSGCRSFRKGGCHFG